MTSFVDFYGFKHKGDESPETLQAAINLKTKAEIRRKYDESKVFSYVQKYEFEGLRLPVFVTFECQFLEGPDGLSGAGPGRIS